MNQYQNSCIGLSVAFPDNWSFRYWGNRNNPLVNPESHQTSFDDLPSEKSPQKILVTSLIGFEKSPSLINAVFELVALFRPNGIDFLSEFPVNDSEISRSDGKCIVATHNATFLHLETQGEGYIRYTRYYHWPFSSNILLGCVISGSSPEKFNEALSILEKIEKL